MDQQEHAAFKELLQHYEEALKDSSLPPTERARCREMSISLRDAFLQVWLPPGTFRRAIVLALIASGLYDFGRGSEGPPWLR